MSMVNAFGQISSPNQSHAGYYKILDDVGLRLALQIPDISSLALACCIAHCKG